MSQKKKILIIFLIAVVLFCFSLLFVSNSVSGMFVGQRWYGTPTSPVSIHKLTVNISEAEKVNYESGISLIRSGWEIDVDPVKVVFNFIIFSFASFALVNGYDKLSKNKRSQK